MIEKKILLTDCPDDQGLIAKITNICYKHQLNILHNNEFVDFETKHFFMRTELEGIFNETTLLEDLKYSLPQGTNCRLIDGKRKSIVILVTKEAHCLGDILMKDYYGALNIEIAAVIGNHDNLRELVERFNIPFHLVSHEGLNRIEHDKLLAEHIDEYAPDYANLLLRLLQQIQKITIVRLNAERYPGEIPAELHALAARLPVELVQLWYQIGGDTWQNLPYQPDARMALEMGLLRMIALQPLLPDADPQQAPTIHEAASATAANDLTAILQDTTPSGTTAASINTDNSIQTEPPAPSGETTAASINTDNSAHTESPALPSGTTPPPVAVNPEEAPPPWEDMLAADDNDIPPWVSETIPDESAPASAPSVTATTEKKTVADVPASDDALSLELLVDNLERWSTFLTTLDLHEYPLLLLENSIPVAWQAPRLSLQTGASGIIFDQKQNREQAAAAIAAKLGINCIIDIQPGDAITTPIDYRRQQSAAQQKQAETDFHNHPQVQAAQAVFGDSLRVDNIQPTNPSQT